MKRKLHTCVLLATLALGGPAAAAIKPPPPMTRAGYEAEQAKIERESRATLKICQGLKGQRQDICETEAKGRAQALKAELEAKYRPSVQAWFEARMVTAEANYDVARARCELLKGKAESRCVRQAKAAREAAERQAKVEKVKETGGAFAGGSARRARAPES